MSYSIGEFAKIVGVNKSTLRYYEMEGLLTPHRNENHLREYTDHDIGWVQFLLHLKDSGMSMIELRQYTEWRAMGDDTIPERLDLLEQRKRLVEQEIQKLQKSMNILNLKTVFYRDKLKGEIDQFVFNPKEIQEEV